MKLPNIAEVTTAEQATELAKDWQSSCQDNNYSYGELLEYAVYFEQLARKFELEEEFEENGII